MKSNCFIYHLCVQYIQTQALAVTQEKINHLSNESRSLTALELTAQIFDNLGRVVEEMMSFNCSNLDDITPNGS